MAEPADGRPESDASSEGLVQRLDSLWQGLGRELWRAAKGEALPIRMLRSTAQLVVLTVQGFQEDQLLLRASALTYITALSVIPMLAVVIAILGVVGGDETIVNFAIEQMTSVAPEVKETVRGYATGLDFSGFGTVGGAIVFGTTVFALRHLGGTLNDIWGVVESRSWPRRFADYLAVMVVAPILTGVAVSVGTTLQSKPAVDSLLRFPFFATLHGVGLERLPLFVLFVAFTFLYWFFPNTRVQVRAAALGGAVAAVLFSAARGIYVDFQIGAATYQTVFGALSAVPLILAWLYVCWAVLLLGAEVAFAAQNLPFARREIRSGRITAARREIIAVEIAVTIAQEFRAQRMPPTAEDLAEVLDEPVRLVRRILEELDRAALIRAVASEDKGDAGFVPAAPIQDLSIGQVLRAVRGEVGEGADEGDRALESVREAIGRLDHAWQSVADETTLESLARESSGDCDGSVGPTP